MEAIKTQGVDNMTDGVQEKKEAEWKRFLIFAEGVAVALEAIEAKNKKEAGK